MEYSLMSFIKVSKSSSKHFKTTVYYGCSVKKLIHNYLVLTIYYGCLVKKLIHNYLVCRMCTVFLINDESESCGLKIYE